MPIISHHETERSRRHGLKLLPGVFMFLAFLTFGQAVDAACGGSGEEPCSCTLSEVILEGCEACRGARFKIPFVNECTDTSGWPASCGGTNEPVCSGGILETLGIGACKPGFINVAGTCRIPDSDGYPTFCGGGGERPCRINEKFPACKLGLLDIGGTCVSLASLALDDDNYPSTCGDVGEPICLSGVISALLDLGFDIEPCKPHPTETIVAPFGRCTIEAFPNVCGRNGQRPCTLLENIPSCMSGLREIGSDFGVCGTDPIDWGKSDADEASRGGPRTVFFIHGRNTDFSDFGKDELAKRLMREAANVSQVYGVDWHNVPVAPGSEPAPVRTRKLLDTGEELDSNWDFETEPWGVMLVDAESYEITDVAFAAAEAIRELPTESEITIIATSFGGVMARQLVYRHYDELRKVGKRIAEVITVGSPHRGGLAGDIDYDPDAAALQTKFACLENSDRNGCQLGEWIEWMDERERGSLLRDPWYIDNRDYPQIRWITLTSNGRKLDLSEVIDPIETQLDDPPLFFPTADANDLLDRIKPWSFGSLDGPFPDSDGVVTVRSAFGIASDECYPFLRSAAPDGSSSSRPVVVPNIRRSEVQEDVFGFGDSATCYHQGARVDLRVSEGILDEHGQPDELFGVGHADMGGDEVQSFILAALNLLGDTNGDGRVDVNDLVADAGSNYTTECTGSATIVNLDASDSFTGNVAGLSYRWTGPFGTVVGAAPSVSLPLGAHSIALELTDPTTGFTSTDVIVVTVSDTTAPSVDDGLSFTLEATSASGTPFDIAPQGSDLCSDVVIEVTPTLAAYALGTTLVSVTATDTSGNQALGTITVDVVDTTPPALTLPADVVAEANGVQSTIAIGKAVATDIFPVTVLSNAPSTYPLGTTHVLWTATDANGNETFGSQSVNVVDTTPPVITTPADVVVVASGVSTSVDIGLATATDIFGATVSSNAPASFPVGATTVTWTAVDGNGNEATATHLVEVIYEFDGFGSPIQPGGTYKANRTLPIKFGLSLVDGTPVTSAVATLSVVVVGTDDSLSEPLDVEANGSVDEGNLFRYRDNHYQFNLKTNGWAPARYRLGVMLDDGRSYSMDITLK